jgi:exopolyphosphatase/guanosine-5'-triphosphate,3'-diphosphate pyrophosphatase
MDGASVDPTIVPRWEWRSFGESFGEAETRLGGLAPTTVEDSDELYVLSRRFTSSVKVRGGKLDVKRLEEVSVDGLERWRPVAKLDFPISASAVAALLEGLDVAVPALGRETYDRDQLVGEVVEPLDGLLAAPVSKHRVRYVIDGCMAELTHVRSGSRTAQTIAVEDEDPTVVRSTVKALGLWARPNVSVPRGLAQLVGFGGPRYAVVDVGTNSVKLVVGERSVDGSWTDVVDRSEVTRLGQGLAASDRLDPFAIARTRDAIVGMVVEARSSGAVGVVATGTAWMRAAGNSDELVAEVLDRTGLRIEMIDGEEEARLSYLAAIAGLPPLDGSLVVFETGGGSTQFTFGHADRVEDRFSVDVGAVRLTEQFGLARAVDERQIGAVVDAVVRELVALDGRLAPDALVGMGGALTNLAAVKHELAAYDPDVVRGTVLDVADLERQIELYRTRDADERRAIVGLQPKRADIILAGACIVRAVLAKLGSASLVVSDRGLRHQLLVERFGS